MLFLIESLIKLDLRKKYKKSFEQKGCHMRPSMSFDVIFYFMKNLCFTFNNGKQTEKFIIICS